MCVCRNNARARASISTYLCNMYISNPARRLNCVRKATSWGVCDADVCSYSALKRHMLNGNGVPAYSRRYVYRNIYPILFAQIIHAFQWNERIVYAATKRYLVNMSYLKPMTQTFQVNV